MIHGAWPYLAVMLVCAGLFPALEKMTRWKLFEVLPPIVLIYLLVTALAVGGLWTDSDAIKAAQQAVTAHVLPAMIFLLLATCDLRAVIRMGPRLLATFLLATTSICLGFFVAWLAVGRWLPDAGWMVLSAVNGSWVGGTANLIAVKQAIGMPDPALAQALLMDALCYSLWVMALFAAVPFAARFNAWTRARTVAGASDAAPIVTAPASGGFVLLWLGAGLIVGLLASEAAAALPTSSMLTATTWKLLLATLAGLAVAHTPLGRMPGSFPLASALLLVLVAVMASQSSFHGLLAAPLFVLAGLIVLAVHLLIMTGGARLFRLDLATCSVASLANIGGVASAPLIAAAHSPLLVPVAVLMAMLGYVLGTGAGLTMAALLSRLAGS